MTWTYPATHEPIGVLLTADEYDALPPNNLRELVDGVVRVAVTPTLGHQDVADALKNALRGPGGEHGYRVSGPIEVRLGNLLRRNPDIIVVRQEHYDRHAARVPREHVALAVEVVSPGSETDDRRAKPIEYAEAGIEHYWRVEIYPAIAIHTFRRGDDGYVETGVWKAGDVVDAPGMRWAQIPVGELDAD